jgi:Integrase core domain
MAKRMVEWERQGHRQMGAALPRVGPGRAPGPQFQSALLPSANTLFLIRKGFGSSPVALERLAHRPRIAPQPGHGQSHSAPCRNEPPALDRPYAPGTNGNAERFIQTALREWAYARSYQNSTEREQQLDRRLHDYNFHRPPASLNLNTPVSGAGLNRNNLLSLHN